MIQLSNRFVTKIRIDKSNGSILLELSMPTYGDTTVPVPSLKLGPPRPLPQASVPLPPEPRGGGRTYLRVRGVGESQIQRLEKKLSTLSTLCMSCSKLPYAYI
jgi:hypothetical protein